MIVDELTTAFEVSHVAHGEPTMAVVAPSATWALPAGHAYDEATDTIANNAGSTLAPLSAYWLSTDVDYVPESLGRTAQRLGGPPAPGTLEVWVRAANLAAAMASHLLVVDGNEYSVAEQVVVPGMPSTAPALIRLERATRGMRLQQSWRRP